MAARFLVGIDLGTVNTALAYADLAAPGHPADGIRHMPIPQLVAPGEVAERRLLPSSAYLPGPEIAASATRLPWGERPVVVGELARELGARMPGRLVSSAKSWLAQPRVDRTAPILPWGAPEGVPRLSPVSASALYLGHLLDAWNHRHPGDPLEAQEVVLTVPASFDEVARELTLRAAEQAGLPRPTLLEEPQAAFYDWSARSRGDLAAALGEARLVLVVDVGGGTTDLTLVAARVEDGRPAFTRVAVGDHLLLGGDNADVALARRAEERLGQRLDAARFSALVQVCRLAKERLMSPGGPERTAVAVAGRGSRLVESAVSGQIDRDEVRRLLLDGFFPFVGPDERPRHAARMAGLAELGLPYEPDPAVTRHAAAFLAAHAVEASGARPGAAGLPRPDAVLVNGGFFTPPEVRARLAEVVSSWFPGAPPVQLLESPALDLAVARGAAHFALVRRGLGLRIGGGSPRAYYVGVAVGGMRERDRRSPRSEAALCVVPRHLDEGSRVSVPRTFALALGRPVRFSLYASTAARLEQPGDVVAVSDDLVSLPPIETVLTSPSLPPPAALPSPSAPRPAVASPPPRGGESWGEGAAARDVQVRLEASLSEIGTLELWCAAEDREARWKLEFQLRGEAGEEGRTEVAAMPRRFDEARALVELYYGKRSAAVERKEVKGLLRALEKVLGRRETWTTPVIRELWGALHAGQARRRRTAEHERVWMQLTGWCLRPGFGAPLDAWRAAETFQVFAEGPQYQTDPHTWQAWWVMWRRIAGGLDAAAQERVFQTVAPLVRPPEPRRPPPRVAGAKPEAVDEMIRLVGSLERIDVSEKVEAGEWILARLEQEGPAPHLLWAIGRLGARVPFYGSGHACVPAPAAEEWIGRLLAPAMARPEIGFALAQLGRRSGDRVRDVDEAVRARVLAALAETRAPEDMAAMVREVEEASEEEERRIFGESLPPGLRLVDGTADQAEERPAPAT